MRARGLHDRFARLLALRRFWIPVIGLLFGIPLISSLSRRAPTAVPVLGQLPVVPLEDADGAAIDVGGRAWVGAFLDPACESCCARAVAALRRVQVRTRNLGAAFAILTMSLDPDATGEWLRTRRALERANPRIWWFVRGLDVPRIERAAAALVPAPRAAGLASGSDVILVDSRVRLRGIYATDGSADDDLLADLTLILNRDR